MKPTHCLFVAAWFVVSPSVLLGQSWDGNGSTDTVPTTGNTAVLNDTSANRTVISDSGASGAAWHARPAPPSSILARCMKPPTH